MYAYVNYYSYTYILYIIETPIYDASYTDSVFLLFTLNTFLFKGTE